MAEVTRRYDELVSKHGTLAEFQEAVWRAANDLMITDDEAIAGIRKYTTDLADAALADLKEERELNQPTGD